MGASWIWRKRQKREKSGQRNATRRSLKPKSTHLLVNGDGSVNSLVGVSLSLDDGNNVLVDVVVGLKTVG